MSEQKTHQFRPPLYHREAIAKQRTKSVTANGESSREQQGWDAYRKWLSRVSERPATQRSPLDHSIYSWKGYNSWADRVRQSWKSEDS